MAPKNSFMALCSSFFDSLCSFQAIIISIIIYLTYLSRTSEKWSHHTYTYANIFICDLFAWHFSLNLMCKTYPYGGMHQPLLLFWRGGEIWTIIISNERLFLVVFGGPYGGIWTMVKAKPLHIEAHASQESYSSPVLSLWPHFLLLSL